MDNNDFKWGLGNLTVFQNPEEEPFGGGELLLPEYWIGFDVREGDTLFFDVHQIHCNNPIVGKGRISFTCYAMENISTCPETLGIEEIMNPKPFQRREVVDSGEEEETPDGTIAKRLRKKRKVNYAQEAERDDEDEDEEAEEAEREDEEAEGEEQSVRKRDKVCEVEWNTPEYLAKLINEFAETFDGSFLDVAWNPDCYIRPHYKYGRLSDNMENFVDALSLENWGVPADRTELHPTTWSKPAGIAFMNPPFRSMNPDDNTAVGMGRFVTKLLGEMEKGRVKAAIVFLPLVIFAPYIKQLLETEPLVALMQKRLTFELSKYDQQRSKSSLKPNTSAIHTWALYYLELGGRTKEEEFVRIFGDVAYIPGHNLPAYQPPPR